MSVDPIVLLLIPKNEFDLAHKGDPLEHPRVLRTSYWAGYYVSVGTEFRYRPGMLWLAVGSGNEDAAPVTEISPGCFEIRTRDVHLKLTVEDEMVEVTRLR